MQQALSPVLFVDLSPDSVATDSRLTTIALRSFLLGSSNRSSADVDRISGRPLAGFVLAGALMAPVWSLAAWAMWSFL